MEEGKKSVDIKENRLLQMDREILTHLLKDRTTDRNIMWCTNNYKKYGSQYEYNQPIAINLITSKHGNIIKPRVEKSKHDQIQRIRDKAEVFTPSWICNKQNNLIDNAWFGRENIFNIETERGWYSIKYKIEFPSEQGKNWIDYVELNRMEISCGEAPYIASRYDTVSGNYIEVSERIGLLDRKLRVIGENTNTENEWLTWAYRAVQSIYGFDWQGDNILIARENILFDVLEYFEIKFNKKIETSHIVELAKIISWNIWQMDGIKFVVPESCTTEKKEFDQPFLFEELSEKEQVCECKGCKKGDNLKHNGIYCKVMDWKTHKSIRYVDLTNGKE
ncbi:restriction endonuclease subunit M [Treponema pectinovorum]|uniref:restriction endonuclease subunit M n=1 Tax=Treponema pectinovorum TaxID=164 RepID=UPI0011CB7CD7|nr:restriction endonuclease subunit M [Treponema pectinovorum]